MRSLFGAITAAALLAGGLSPEQSGHGGFILPTLARDTQADRRKRNLAAGGREKRIKNSNSLRSRPRRSHRFIAQQTDGRVFKSDNRETVFRSALADGELRNEALKIARRVAA